MQLHEESVFFSPHLSLSLGILSVLSLSSECTSLASELPKVSYVKAIDIWMIACLLYGFGSLVEYAVVQVGMLSAVVLHWNISFTQHIAELQI